MQIFEEVYNKYPRIKIEGQSDLECGFLQGKDIISALDFVVKERGVDSKELSFKLILSRDYVLTHNRIHIEKIKDDGKTDRMNQPNGEFIPRFLYKDEYKKIEAKTQCDGMININCGKLRLLKTDKIFVSSVIVHEVGHYLDFKLLLPEIEKRYGFDFQEVKVKRDRCDAIGGMYIAYSEMHAKYLQEKYDVVNRYITKECIVKNYRKVLYTTENKTEQYDGMNLIITPKNCNLKVDYIKGEDDIHVIYYKAQHFVGSSKAWSEIFEGEEKIVSEIKNAKGKYIDEVNNYREIIDQMEGVFDWKDLLLCCDDIRNYSEDEFRKKSGWYDSGK